MKLSLLLLPLFIAVCAAVSKSHLSLRRFRSSSQENTVQIPIPAGVALTIKALVNSSFQQRVTISNGKGKSYTWEGVGEHSTLIGQATVNSPAAGSTWTVTMEFKSNGVWKPSRVDAPTLAGYNVNNLVIIPILAENGDDTDNNDAVVTFSYNKK